MNRNVMIGLIAVVVIVVGAALTFPLWRPLFVDDVVEEAFPTFTDEQRAAFNAMPEAEQQMYLEMADGNAEMALEMAVAALANDAETTEDMPEAVSDEPAAVVAGSFIEIDFVHSGEGTATVFELPDGSHLLRLEDFRVTNGPDLHVVLSTAEDPRDSAELGEDYVDLGMLKGNVGSQNYEIPADVDISQFNSVVIYCLPFHVVFSTATLS
jgi:hypothetical protein